MRDTVSISELEVDLRFHRVRVANQDIRFGKKERALLELLVRNANQTLTHQQLLTEIWGDRYGDESKYLLHTLVKRVREKLGDIPPRLIVAEADIGYRFESSVYTPAAPLPPCNLPHAITSFVGRVRELHALSMCLLRPDIRLITLTGVGGVGKTRLAIAVAEQLRHTFPDGVHFVALAMLTEPALVLPTIARSLGIEEQPGGIVSEQLGAYLRAKRLLLILDNLEQVASVAPALTKLLTGAPGLTILVTSRIALQVSGEHVFVVPPLPLPDPSYASSLDLLAENPAIALFVVRAQAVVTTFLLTEHNGPVIAAICTRLEGLPLAIELAAARLRLFTPPALLARLDHRLAVLVGGGHDLHARQQTIRNTIAWSYDLLREPMQTLLVQLSVFVGSFSLGAAEAVGDLEDNELSIAEAIEALIAQSLLQRVDQTETEPRFAMLEAIREYTLEQLVARGIAPAVRERHAAYYLALAEQAEPELQGPQQVAWFDRLEQDHANLRMALGWLRDQGRTEDVLRLCGALWRFWYVQGYITEGRQWFGQVLDDTEAIPREVRAKAFDGAGVMAMVHGHYMEAQLYHETALQLYRELGDRRKIAGNLESLGHVGLYLRDYERAIVLYEEGLEIRREEHDLQGIASSLNNLGTITFFQGDYQSSQKYTEEALDISRKIGDFQGVADRLANLAAIAYYRRQFDRALELYKESLRTNYQVKECIVICVEGVALILVEMNKLEQAALFFGAVAQVRDSSGLLAYTESDDQTIQVIDTVKQRLGEDWSIFWNKGRSTPIDQIVASALLLSL